MNNVQLLKVENSTNGNNNNNIIHCPTCGTYISLDKTKEDLIRDEAENVLNDLIIMLMKKKDNIYKTSINKSTG